MAILAAVLVPTVTSKIGQANESSANSTASAIANSVRTDIISIQSGIFTSLDVLEVAGDAETTNVITINDKKFKAQANVGAGTKGTTAVTVAEGTVTVATTVSGRRATYTVTLATNGAITVSEPTYDKV